MWGKKYKLLGLFILGLLLIFFIAPVYSISPNSSERVSEVSLTSDLMQQGRELYQQGRLAEAATVWLEAGENYAKKGDKLHQAMSLNYLALAQQELGEWEKALEAIATSLTLLNSLDLNNEKTALVFAQALNTQGRLELNMGNPQLALTSLEQATEIYQQLGDETGVMGSLINQAQAMTALGFHSRTCETLLLAMGEKGECEFLQEKELTQVVQTYSKYPEVKVLGLRSLGNIFRLLGNFEVSQKLLEETRHLPQSPQEESLTLLSSGKTEVAMYRKALELSERSSGKEKERAQTDAMASAQNALAFYGAAAETSPILGGLERLNLLIELSEGDSSRELITENLDEVAQSLAEEIANLPPSRAQILTQLNFAASLGKLGQYQEAMVFATQANVAAQHLGDLYGASYALGILGNLAEKTQNWDLAQKNTEAALSLAQSMQASELGYKWQWQLGRIYEGLGEREKAIAVYQGATQTLDAVRSNLLTVDSEIQFSFRDNVYPVYRELANLLLSNPQQQDLVAARQVIESLQVAELENFLKCSFRGNQSLEIDTIVNRENSQEAVFYPIVLEDRIEVILKLPLVDELRHYRVDIAEAEVNQVIQQLRIDLAYSGRKKEVQKNAQKIYQWLIEPIKADLETNQIKTLVFVLDPVLGNIPMAVLYNGEKYLIEDYAIAYTSGLQLLTPQTLATQNINVLLAGITQENQGYPPLKNVKRQLEKINTELKSEVIIDETFTVNTFENKITTLPYSIVHIATHGNFSSDPQNTFILAWDDEIDVFQLKNLFQSREEIRPNEPIELLVLAACETAKGDKRATLGLAGMALNTGVRSIISTLWKISADESPGELLSYFYRELKNNPQISKAEALRQAQLQFLNDNDRQAPYFWAPYILLGNWL
ncbi:MAG: CHAT domain-containing protein [Gomphosphaeria aponina SAG 52.96 = DSM 107014]|uniref:CHAT domain-containing protein n=1 Tax=Gomphosphaeria aponina SAG 52.96 = DSM 107014 TaxID=1521640 RepID=A0A941GX01_9CHRO|nr:CHAT domain-containing protein [Gomphosphaeria aponina SAG 52.96 = DSM 107014]